MNDNLKLGTKVECTGYIKKVGTKHVALESERKDFKTETELEKEFEEMCLLSLAKPFEYTDYMLASEVLFVNYDEPISQITRIINHCVFKGIIVAKKRIPTIRWFEVIDQEYANIIKTQILKEESNFIYCYQVFFRMGGSRLVPVGMCEVIEDVL